MSKERDARIEELEREITDREDQGYIFGNLAELKREYFRLVQARWEEEGR